ncbi:uncharacterized protein LOC143143647 [Ptiloglossa arizonensis]|uniref:uncharacterized protein LOC143143647 n=1 Tax=Ptiloglossa arizonensis TaxID=3350558 RepID=UPI003F9FAF42
MNAERYYVKKNDGSYAIHFPNCKGTSIHELEKLFSTFGKVLSIENRGKSHGLCFVRYQNIEDVERCLDSLQNHQDIRILPQKFKSTTGSNIKAHPLNHSFQGQALDDQSKDAKTCKSGECTKLYNQGDNRSISSDCSNTSSARNADIENLTHKSPFPKHLVENTFEKSFDANEIPSLIYNDEKSTSISGFRTLIEAIIPAQEIIVANVHPNLGIHYILHLLEKYNPISVSLMMTIPRTGIRYCHVYFKTFEEALAAEREFDTHNLSGNNLIVLRSQKLMKEAF